MDSPASPSPSAPAPAGFFTRMKPNVLIFLTSACLMAVEMTAGRMVSRAVGSSIYTWTCVIGVIFAGMSVGNYLGGRLAARWRPSALLGTLLLLSSASVLLVLWLGIALDSALHSDWESRRPDFRGGPAVTETTLHRLKAKGAPEAVLAALQGEQDVAHFDTTRLEKRLRDIGAAVPEKWISAAVDAAEPVGSTWQILRERGVPEVVLTVLTRPLPATEPEDDRAAPSARTYRTADDLRAVVDRSLRQPVVEEWFAGDLAAQLDHAAGAAATAKSWPALHDALRAADASPEVVSMVRLWWAEATGGISAPLPAPLAGDRAKVRDEWGAMDKEGSRASVLRQGYVSTRRRAAESDVVDAATEPGALTFPVRLVMLTMLAFFGPAVALGLISPPTAQMAVDAVRSGGRAIGNVYAWGAWGSIIGTFLTGFVLTRVLGCHRTIAASAEVLALLAVAFAPARLLQITWLVVLTLLVSPVFLQYLEDDALTPRPTPQQKRDKAAAESGRSQVVRFLHDVPRSIGETIHLRDRKLGVDAVESDYQLVSVAANGDESDEGQVNMHLSLDHLIHGYCVFEKTAVRNDKGEIIGHRYEMDTTRYGYDALRSYSALIGRSLRAGGRVKEPDESAGEVNDPGRLILPPLRGLCLGGGSYTFERCVVANFPGDSRRTTAGESWMSIAGSVYGAKSDAAKVEVAARLRLHDWQSTFKWLRSGPRPAVTADAAELGRPLPVGRLIRLPTIIDVAELDPAVTEVNYTRLHLARPEEDPRIKTWNYDARNFVESAVVAGWGGQYDFISADCVNHYNVPYHLTTVEFNEKVKSLLKPGGVFVSVVIDEYRTSRFMSAFLNTLKKSYRKVGVLVARHPSSRTSRDTFTVVASDSADLDLDYLGGWNEETRQIVKAGKPADIIRRLQDSDPESLDLMLRQMSTLKPADGKTPAEAMAERLRILKRLDARSLVGPAAKPEHFTGEVAMRQVALQGAEMQEILIDHGRPPGLGGAVRNLPLMRSLLGRAKSRYSITADGLKKLAAGPVPPEVAAKLKAAEGESFGDVDALCRRMAVLLSEAEFAAWRPRLTKAFHDMDAERRPALILTDDLAPTDDLLAPLLDDK